jgi:hypothetical protein
MILISHRGNINGPNKERENSPAYIKEAVDAGFEVEIDVWYKDKKWYLGHDEPQHEIDPSFLSYEPFWCHAKNLEALTEMAIIGNYIWHKFWHENDRYTLTSCGHIWTFPRVLEVNKRCIIVCPEIYPDGFDFSFVGGICSDHITDYKKYK